MDDPHTQGADMSTSRIQLALNVENVAEATAFYERLFGAPPHKQRDGYANFAIEDPPLKLVLIENPGSGGGLNHLGVEAPAARDVTEALERFHARARRHRGRAGFVLPRRAGQGVHRRPRRSAGLVGVLRRHRRQSRQPGRAVDVGVRAKLRGSGHGREHLAASDHRRKRWPAQRAGHRARRQPQPQPRRCHRRGRVCSPPGRRGRRG